MKNQKHAVPMAPDKQFKVLQTQEGNALFFSIGTDAKFYVTREIPQDVSGWSKFDLSSVLSGDKVTANAFDVSQNIANGTADIALAVTIDGVHYLYTALGVHNSDADWAAAAAAGKINFALQKFDDSNNPSYGSLPISDVYVSKIGHTKLIVVDILKDSSTGMIFRYFVDPSKSVLAVGMAWNPRDLAGNLNAGTIDCYLGRKDGMPVDGMYTFGSIGGVQELMYTPLYNYDKKSVAPPVYRLDLPDGSTAMALSANSDDLTDVFVAANGGLWFLDCESQDDDTSLSNVYTHDLFSGIERLHVNNNGTTVVAWALNQQGQIFYMTCAAGSEYDQSSWSYPVVILEGVQDVASYMHSTQQHLVIFAHMQDGDQLVQLVQDPGSSLWTKRQIILPGAVYTDVIEDYTFTTHIQLTDESNIALSNQPITLSASATCSVYIDNVYHALYAQQPLQLTSDFAGVITIVQAVDCLAGVTFTLTDGTTKAYANPLNNLIDKLKDIKGEDLNVSVSDEQGNQKQLLGTSIDSKTLDDIATYIQKFISLNSGLNVDGTPVADDSVSAAPLADAAVFGMSFANGGAKYYDSDEKAATLGLKPLNGVPAAVTSAAALQSSGPGYDDGFNYGDAVLILAGDAWNWLKKEFANLERWEIRAIGKINHFFFELAEKTYHFAIRCAHDIAQGIHFILSKIAIAFEDMVKWIGMIFSFKDILRTHTVLKNVINIIIQDTRDNFSGIKDKITDVFTTFEDKIAQLTHLDAIDSTYSSCTAKGTPQKGSQSPSANWSTHQMKSNGGSADSDYSATPSDDPTNGLLDELYNLLVAEGEAFSDAGDEIKAIVENITSQPITTSILQLIGVVSELLVKSAQNILTAAVDVLAAMMADVTDTLNAEMRIPVLSKLYEDIVGGPFTVLDVACLIAAFPITVIYKATRGEAPFPAGDMTTSLTNAKDMAALQAVLFPPSASAAHGVSYHVDSGSLLDRLTISGNIAALVGAFFMSWITLVKSGFPKVPGPLEDAKNKKLTPINSALYLLYVFPDALITMPGWYKLGYNWTTDFNSVCTTLGIGKAVVDAYSPWMVKVADKYNNWIAPGADFIINAAWQIPTTFGFYYQFDGKSADTSDANEIVSFIGGTTFDISGMLSPLLVKCSNLPEDPEGTREVKIAAVAWTMAAANVIWGASCVVTSFDGLPNG